MRPSPPEELNTDGSPTGSMLASATACCAALRASLTVAPVLRRSAAGNPSGTGAVVGQGE